MTKRAAFLTRRRWIRRPVKQLRKTVAARPVRRLDVAASAQLLIIVGRKGPGAALVSRSLPHEEAPCRRKANPRQATGAAASAPWRALMWLLAFHAVERLRFSKKGNRMPIIRANAGIITQINVFTVPDGDQQALIDLLSESAHLLRKRRAGSRPACTRAATDAGRQLRPERKRRGSSSRDRPVAKRRFSGSEQGV
jgi:hypothetical protein